MDRQGRFAHVSVVRGALASPQGSVPPVKHFSVSQLCVSSPNSPPRSQRRRTRTPAASRSKASHTQSARKIAVLSRSQPAAQSTGCETELYQCRMRTLQELFKTRNRRDTAPHPNSLPVKFLRAPRHFFNSCSIKTSKNYRLPNEGYHARPVVAADLERVNSEARLAVEAGKLGPDVYP